MEESIYTIYSGIRNIRQFSIDYPDEYLKWIMDKKYKFRDWDEWLYDNYEREVI